MHPRALEVASSLGLCQLPDRNMLRKQLSAPCTARLLVECLQSQGHGGEAVFIPTEARRDDSVAQGPPSRWLVSLVLLSSGNLSKT